MSKIQRYKPKRLIDGKEIQQQPGTNWVAVPDKFAGRQLVVEYLGSQMTIKNWREEAKMYRRFHDKFWKEGGKRPRFYTLGYFEFKPDDGTIVSTWRVKSGTELR